MSIYVCIYGYIWVYMGICGYICVYIYLARFTRRCLLTCDKAGAGDWQPVGLSVATVTTVRPC